MGILENREIVALFLERDEAAIKHTSEKYGRRLRSLSHGIVKDLQTQRNVKTTPILKHGTPFHPTNQKITYMHFWQESFATSL